MYKLTLLCSVLLLLVAGCANMHVAQSPDEFRNDIIKSEDPRYKHDSYEVKRSFSAISKTLQEKSEECLNYTFERAFSYRMGSAVGANTSIITYVPTFKASNDQAELHVQMDVTGNVYLSYTPPKGGAYVLTADLVKKSKSTTQVDLYYGSYKANILPSTIKKWIDGKSEGCPDLKEDMASGVSSAR